MYPNYVHIIEEGAAHMSMYQNHVQEVCSIGERTAYVTKLYSDGLQHRREKGLPM